MNEFKFPDFFKSPNFAITQLETFISSLFAVCIIFFTSGQNSKLYAKSKSSPFSSTWLSFGAEIMRIKIETKGNCTRHFQFRRINSPFPHVLLLHHLYPPLLDHY